jgi:hypothetical protein
VAALNRYRQLGNVVVVAAFACRSNSALPVEAELLLEVEPSLSSSASAQEVLPPEPVTAAKLVAEGKYWRLATKRGPVHVWIPKGYRARRADTIVYVHGYYTDVDGAWDDHNLPFQFAASTINAMFVACEAPAGPRERVAWESLAELLATVDAAIEDVRQPRRRVVAVGHSGAYRTLLNWLSDETLDTVVLLDAAYGEIESYRDWVLASPKRRLIDVGDDTKQWTERLHAQLPSTVILEGFPPAEEDIPASVARAKILYIRSELGHFPLVTGGIALPMVLRTLRMRRLLDVPLADLVEP